MTTLIALVRQDNESMWSHSHVKCPAESPDHHVLTAVQDQQMPPFMCCQSLKFQDIASGPAAAPIHSTDGCKPLFCS